MKIALDIALSTGVILFVAGIGVPALLVMDMYVLAIAISTAAGPLAVLYIVSRNNLRWLAQ